MNKSGRRLQEQGKGERALNGQDWMLVRNALIGHMNRSLGSSLLTLTWSWLPCSLRTWNSEQWSPHLQWVHLETYLASAWFYLFPRLRKGSCPVLSSIPYRLPWDPSPWVSPSLPYAQSVPLYWLLPLSLQISPTPYSSPTIPILFFTFKLQYSLSPCLHLLSTPNAIATSIKPPPSYLLSIWFLLLGLLFWLVAQSSILSH